MLVLSWPTTVFAEGRTPAEATVHAREELANAVAQGKTTLTPAPSATRASLAAWRLDGHPYAQVAEEILHAVRAS